MRDALWCVADAHFEPADPALEVFGDLLEAFRGSTAGVLALMGDLFSVWIGVEGAQGEEHRFVTRRLNALRKCGKRVVYLTGNRDYLLENIHPVPFDRLADAWDWTSAAGERFHFEHGDLINTADAAYLRWRSFSRSASTLGLFRQLPRAAQDAVARALQRKMAPTNRTYKAYEPEREMRRWAEDLVQRGYGGAVLGHFHRDVEITVAGLRIRMLPQFREDGAHLRIMGDGSWKLHRLR